MALCTIRRKDNLKKMLQMFPDDDIRETIINYADGAGEENTVNLKYGKNWKHDFKLFLSFILMLPKCLLAFIFKF